MERPVERWKPPDTTTINTDGAVSFDKDLAASGMVARNATSFCGAACKVYRNIQDPLIIEALALRDAFTFAAEHGYSVGCVLRPTFC